ncbi:MAG: cytochrome ubiquinol oxidase subunit I, partial [Rhodomicrobium sp.]|nr:cytochrome ubiquinol oxidase subunit I [Rhodomicrobium sp.]
GLGLAIVLAPLQLLIGDQHGLSTAEYQPAKLAAIEGHWDGSKPAKLVLFGLPDEATGRNDYEVAIPHAGALIITHSWNGLFKGLKDFKPEDLPPLLLPFFAFRLMVAIGLWLIFLAFAGGYLWWRGRLFENRLFLRAASLSWPLGFIAIVAGWTVTEVGRQPWAVTGLIRTAEAASPLAAGTVGASLILFFLVYLAVYSAGIAYMNALIRRGPGVPVPAEAEEAPAAYRPISAAAETGGRPVAGQT